MILKNLLKLVQQWFQATLFRVLPLALNWLIVYRPASNETTIMATSDLEKIVCRKNVFAPSISSKTCRHTPNQPSSMKDFDDCFRPVIVCNLHTDNCFGVSIDNSMNNKTPSSKKIKYKNLSMGYQNIMILHSNLPVKLVKSVKMP